MLCFSADFSWQLPCILTDSIKQICSGETLPFSHGRDRAGGAALACLPSLFLGLLSLECGYKRGCGSLITYQFLLPCHQLLVRISCNEALFLRGPAQPCVASNICGIQPVQPVSSFWGRELTCNAGSLLHSGHLKFIFWCLHTLCTGQPESMKLCGDG